MRIYIVADSVRKCELIGQAKKLDRLSYGVITSERQAAGLGGGVQFYVHDQIAGSELSVAIRRICDMHGSSMEYVSL